MRGLSDLDSVCLTKIFKNLTLLDLCSLRQCSKGFQDFINDFLHSLYFIREQRIDLREESYTKVHKILKNFGKYLRHLKVCEKSMTTTNRDDNMKGLMLDRSSFNRIFMAEFVEFFDNLEILELNCSSYNQECIEKILLLREYPNLTTLKLTGIENESVETEILRKFFVRKRSITKLTCGSILDHLLPLIVSNAANLEELDIHFIPEDNRNVMSLAQLTRLKRFEIYSFLRDRVAIELINGLSISTKLETLGMSIMFALTNEFCDTLSNFVNLKQFRIQSLVFSLSDTKKIEILSQKMPQLESLMLTWCSNFPYRSFIASVCKSDKLRTLYVYDVVRDNNTFERMVASLIKGRISGCFVRGSPLRIYLEEGMFNDMKTLFKQENFKFLERNANIKILHTRRDIFPYY